MSNTPTKISTEHRWKGADGGIEVVGKNQSNIYRVDSARWPVNQYAVPWTNFADCLALEEETDVVPKRRRLPLKNAV